jgi:hypothetical protein
MAAPLMMVLASSACTVAESIAVARAFDIGPRVVVGLEYVTAMPIPTLPPL